MTGKNESIGLARLSSAKRVVFLLYVVVGVAFAGQATAVAGNYVRWFESLGELTVQVEDVHIDSDGEVVATILARVQNPTGFRGIVLQSAVVVVFLNSSMENFQVQSLREAGELGVKTVSFGGRNVPAESALTLTATISPHEDLRDSARLFLERNKGDIRVFVGVTLTAQSYYGYLALLFCQEFPLRGFTICPGRRAIVQPTPRL